MPAPPPVSIVAILGAAVLAAAGARAAGPVVYVPDTTFAPGEERVVDILVADVTGAEAALGFSLVLDPQDMAFVDLTVGPGAAGAALNLNTAEAATGKVGVALAMPPGELLPLADGPVALARVRAATDCAGAGMRIAFGDVPVLRELVDDGAQDLGARFVNGHAVIGPPEAIASIRLVKQGTDVAIDFTGAGPGPWRVYRDRGKTDLGVTPLLPDPAGESAIDEDALLIPRTYHYQVLKTCTP